MTQRSAFVLHVRPERIDDYVQAHAEVWPEMLEALTAAGIRNYSIFRLD
jgi:L-rhamnose mutarotase